MVTTHLELIKITPKFSLWMRVWYNRDNTYGQYNIFVDKMYMFLLLDAIYFYHKCEIDISFIYKRKIMKTFLLFAHENAYNYTEVHCDAIFCKLQT